ncbi:MAG: hypothetical protein ABWY55_04340 [Microbacterium sp.]
MSGSTPRRRHSPAVYRRRRVVLLVGLLAIVATVWLLIAQPWRGSAAEAERQGATPTKTQDAASEIPIPVSTLPAEGATDPAADPGSSPSATPDAAAPSTTPTAAACVARDVTVEPLTDQDSYGSGQSPLFSIRLTNAGTSDCTLNVGTTTQVFTVTSGSDVWWRSTDCQTAPSDMIVLLAAGQSVTSAAPLAWDRTRSAVDTCATARPVAPGGGASYHLSVQIGGIESDQSKQFLLY